MLYCAKCQVLSKDEDRCPLCGSKKLRQVQPNDPVLLLTASEPESLRIAAAFDEAKIPHMERSLDAGSASSIILGQSRYLQIRVFVPFGEIENAREILRGIGFLDGDEPAAEPVTGEDRLSEQDQEKEEKDISMSRGRRLAVRIFSILAFVALIWLVVTMADSIAGFLKSEFHLFQ